MLRHRGVRALAAGLLLAGAYPAFADSPQLIAPPGATQFVSGRFDGAVGPADPIPGETSVLIDSVGSGCSPGDVGSFDPYVHYLTNSPEVTGTFRSRKGGLCSRFAGGCGSGGCSSGDCGSCGAMGGTCGAGCGNGLAGKLGGGLACKFGGGGLIHRLAQCRGGVGSMPDYLANLPPDGAACDFNCANCWSAFDVEKRFFISWVHDEPYAFATRAGYNEAEGATIGFEVLPWVVTDGSHIYSRWGFTAAFGYYHYNGNKRVSLRSNETQNLLSIDNGDTFSFIIGPTYRCDFDVMGVRMSPNATVGISFDWTDLERIEPQSFVIRRIDRFKYSAFDVGGVIRLMWDFGITDNLNFGIGGQFRFAPTDVMTDDGELRKHIGLVLTVSHQF